MPHSKQVNTHKKKEVLDITDLVEDFVIGQKFQNGLCHIFAKHTTACITTADLDPGTDLDMLDAFEAMMPKLKYRHPHNPAHAPDHILSSIIGPGVMVPVQAGQLQLGTWQRIVFIELDGPRKRDITLSLLSEG